MNLKIKDHFNVEFFNKFRITLRYDAVASTFSFEHYFDPKNKEHRILWQPGHFHIVKLEHKGELLLTGYILSQTFAKSKIKKLSSISGYSLPGVLEDCQIPTSLYPLQSDGLTLGQITSKLLAHFSTSRNPIKLEVDPSVSGKVNSVFDKTTASETDTIKSYLTKMAAQKDIVLSHTPEGNLLYTKAKADIAPIFHFTPGQIGVTDMSLTFDGQAMHSSITLLKQASTEGGNAGQSFVSNPYVPFVRRPAVKKQSSGGDNDTGDAASNALSAELKGIVLTIELNDWFLDGKIVKPNNTILVTDPELYIFEPTLFFIESVDLVGDEKENTASLKCVLPEVYTENRPKNIFEVKGADTK
ncbi:MAG: hypothetical protein IMY67_11310 [Bacteroidetes bacterium]|nr:hypothetical protein [Bacteroidota bacterium]